MDRGWRCGGSWGPNVPSDPHIVMLLGYSAIWLFWQQRTGFVERRKQKTISTKKKMLGFSILACAILVFWNQKWYLVEPGGGPDWELEDSARPPSHATRTYWTVLVVNHTVSMPQCAGVCFVHSRLLYSMESRLWWLDTTNMMQPCGSLKHNPDNGTCQWTIPCLYSTSPADSFVICMLVCKWTIPSESLQPWRLNFKAAHYPM